jgi:hypothetical protein
MLEAVMTEAWPDYLPLRVEKLKRAAGELKTSEVTSTAITDVLAAADAVCLDHFFVCTVWCPPPGRLELPHKVQFFASAPISSTAARVPKVAGAAEAACLVGFVGRAGAWKGCGVRHVCLDLLVPPSTAWTGLHTPGAAAASLVGLRAFSSRSTHLTRPTCRLPGRMPQHHQRASGSSSSLRLHLLGQLLDVVASKQTLHRWLEVHTFETR